MKAWKYQLEKEFNYRHPIFNTISFSNDWLVIKDGKLTIKKGYAWDGCSPKITFLGLFNFGTPDGILYLGKPWLYYPSLVHDVLCQFRRELPLSKTQVVTIWTDMLASYKWPLKWVYRKAVDWFGPQDFNNVVGGQND